MNRAAELASEKAAAGSPSEWIVEARRAVVFTATVRALFTTDQVWWRLTDVEKNPEPRALGAVMRWAAKAGIIEATGEWKESVRTSCHGRPARIWRSLICD